METHSKYFFANHQVEALAEEIRPILIADSFSTPSNVGSIIRLAANIGAKQVIVLNGEHLRVSKIKKTAAAAWDQVDLVFSEIDQLTTLIPSDYSLVALETSEDAVNLYGEPLPSKMALVLGNEKFGMSEDVLKMCHQSRFIPMAGLIKSMNVSHAASVCVFEWYRQNS